MVIVSGLHNPLPSLRRVKRKNSLGYGYCNANDYVHSCAVVSEITRQ
jgi:hypothetical protein